MQRNRLPRRFFFFFFNTNTGLLPYASSPALAFAISVRCSNNVASSYPVVIELNSLMFAQPREHVLKLKPRERSSPFWGSQIHLRSH